MFSQFGICCTICPFCKFRYDRGHLDLEMINLNSSENWLNDDWEGTDTIVPRHETMKIINVTQLEKDAILVCYDSKCSFFSYM